MASSVQSKGKFVEQVNSKGLGETLQGGEIPYTGNDKANLRWDLNLYS